MVERKGSRSVHWIMEVLSIRKTIPMMNRDGGSELTHTIQLLQKTNKGCRNVENK